MDAIRKDILAMSGYTPGEQPQGGDFVKLNTNENPYSPSPAVGVAISEEIEKLRLYSDPMSVALRKTAAEVYGLKTEQVIAGNGSDDILNILVRMCAFEGETVASFSPSYTLYETLAEIQGAKFKKIEFTKDYQIPQELDLTGIKLLFLCNPNAPSGTMVSHDEIRRVCKACSGIVVVDEAYVDFAEENAIPLLQEFDNIVINRTFSKSYSLAGLRLGLAFSSEFIIENMMKIKDSYNLDRLAQAGGIAALKDQSYLAENVAKIKATRAKLVGGLEDMGAFVYPSNTNFVLARFEGDYAKKIYELLKQRNIFVRYFDKEGLRDCLRISVGTDKESEILLSGIRDILESL
jgi:histidinol-phosphate aminotransferase